MILADYQTEVIATSSLSKAASVAEKSDLQTWSHCGAATASIRGRRFSSRLDSKRLRQQIDSVFLRCTRRVFSQLGQYTDHWITNCLSQPSFTSHFEAAVSTEMYFVWSEREFSKIEMWLVAL